MQLSSKDKLFRFSVWMAFDATIILVAYSLGFLARSLTAPLNYANAFAFILFAIGLTLTMLYANKVYHTYWRGASGRDVASIFRATIWSSIALLVISVPLAPRPVPLSIIIIGSILSFGGFVVARYRSRLINAAEWRWRAIGFSEFQSAGRESVLIVGAGESGQMTIRRLRDRSSVHDYKIVGFVDDDPDKQGLHIQSAQVLGKTDDIPALVLEHEVDLVVIAIHNIDPQAFRKMVEMCEQTDARVKVVPDVVKLFGSRISKSFLRDVQPEDIIGREIVARDANVDLSPISNRVILVTGAAGSIGSELARQILRYHNPTRLIILDNNESALFDLELELKAMNQAIEVVLTLADVTQQDAIDGVFQETQPQIVFHAAAYKHVPMLQKYPNQAVRVNMGGTLTVAEAAIRHHVERFVLISTDKAVNPSNVMGASKRVCEMLVHALAERDDHTTMFTAVRFGNVLGSRGSVVPIFNRQIDNGGPVTVTDKEMTRYFMSISEAVNLVIHAAALTNGNDIFVLRMGEVVRIYDLAKRMIRLRGLRPDVDIDIVITGRRPGEKLAEQLTNSFEELDNTIHPGIRKIENWHMNGKSVYFMDEVCRLVSEGLPDDQDPLTVLRDLCKLDYELVRSAE